MAKFPNRQRGFSVVELMVAALLAMLMLAGVLSAVYGSKVTYAENERISRLQENGRAAFEYILRDLRAAGFKGCARPLRATDFSNDTNAPADVRWNFSQPLIGYEASGGGWIPAIDPWLANISPGNDAIIIRTPRIGAPTYTTSVAMGATNSNVVISKPAGSTIAVGAPVLLADCTSASVFTVSGFIDGGATGTILHAAVGNTPSSPGNAASVAYYIAPSQSGSGPALYRLASGADPVNPGLAATPQELIEGVEALQFQYGIDTNGDSLVDRYVTADAVPDWNNVVAVSLSVLIRSPYESGSSLDNRTYQVLDQLLGPFNDRRQRTLFTTTVALRNRTI
jgi:type IV pilus assembly protein PilW